MGTAQPPPSGEAPSRGSLGEGEGGKDAQREQSMSSILHSTDRPGAGKLRNRE